MLEVINLEIPKEADYGISIAKSLTELQEGEFNLNIDGDLFKVELVFKRA